MPHESPILLVDDDRDFLELLRMTFIRHGVGPVKCFDSPALALQFTQQVRPRYVVTDFEMRGMNGAQLMEEMKGIWPEIQGAIITGHTELAPEGSPFTVIYKDGARFLRLLVDFVRTELSALETPVATCG